MKSKNILPESISLIAAGLSLLLISLGSIKISEREILGYIFIFYGIISTYFSFSVPSKRGRLFTAVCVFMTGVLFTVIDKFDFTGYGGLYFSSTLFIIASAFLFLYLSESRNTSFVIAALFLFILSGVSIYFYDSSPIIKFVDSISESVLVQWEIVLIIFGLGLLFGRKN